MFKHQAYLIALALACALQARADSPHPGMVRIDGHTLCDADGPFLGLGATYMQALRHCKFDRERLHRELAFLAKCGFNYVRVLSMVDWPGREIAPVDHTNKEGCLVAAWPDYDRMLTDLVDIVHSHGMRTQATIFADAQIIMPDAEARRRHVQRVVRALHGREDKVILYEIANEGWQNGFPGEQGIIDLRDLARQVADAAPALLALTSPPDTGDHPASLAHLYTGSPATIATMHFSRDLHSVEGGWLPVIDCWDVGRRRGLPPISSNEPVGPGSSVASEDDPEMILAAAAFAYLAGLPMYVFHSDAGVKADRSFDRISWLPQFKALRDLLPSDLPNWERYDSNDAGNPLLAAETDLHPRYNCGARNGHRFIQLPLALSGEERVFRATGNVAFSVFELPAGNKVLSATVNKGEDFTLKVHSRACILKGVIKP